MKRREEIKSAAAAAERGAAIMRMLESAKRKRGEERGERQKLVTFHL